MTATSPSHILPAAAGGPGPRPSVAAVPGAGRRAIDLVRTALEAIGAARGRHALLELARQHQATRPEFAATLRAAARRGWL